MKQRQCWRRRGQARNWCGCLRPIAADAVRLGEARLIAGAVIDLALLDGHYLRRSDAEIFGTEVETKPAAARS